MILTEGNHGNKIVSHFCITSSPISVFRSISLCSCAGLFIKHRVQDNLMHSDPPMHSDHLAFRCPKQAKPIARKEVKISLFLCKVSFVLLWSGLIFNLMCHCVRTLHPWSFVVVFVMHNHLLLIYTILFYKMIKTLLFCFISNFIRLSSDETPKSQVDLVFTFIPVCTSMTLYCMETHKIH